MKKNHKFKSEFLNEQLSKGYLKILNPDISTELLYKYMAGITGNCIMVMLFPNNVDVDTYYYDLSLKNRMIYHLKKEGFVYSSRTGQFGYYIKAVK
jgi:hypothetical protein